MGKENRNNNKKPRKFLQSSLAAEQHVFKRPALRASLLGLNILAAQKHRENERQASSDLADGKDGRTATQQQLPPPDTNKGKGMARPPPDAAATAQPGWRLFPTQGCQRGVLVTWGCQREADSGNRNAVSKEQQPVRGMTLEGWWRHPNPKKNIPV
ncbi:UNVERIFIED_CONTAM: hypothetical protein K2H54_040394 [Gekko kuhli]